jgi:hypothetical protein
MSPDWNTDWLIEAPHSRSKVQVRDALISLGLEVAFDLDVAKLLERRTGVRLSRITVLGVCCPFQLLEGVVAAPASALLQPLHVVITEMHGSTHISVSGVTPDTAIPLHRTIVRVTDALESAGARRTNLSGDLAWPSDSPIQCKIEGVSR